LNRSRTLGLSLAYDSTFLLKLLSKTFIYNKTIYRLSPLIHTPFQKIRSFPTVGFYHTTNVLWQHSADYQNCWYKGLRFPNLAASDFAKGKSIVRLHSNQYYFPVQM